MWRASHGDMELQFHSGIVWVLSLDWRKLLVDNRKSIVRSGATSEGKSSYFAFRLLGPSADRVASKFSIFYGLLITTILCEEHMKAILVKCQWYCHDIIICTWTSRASARFLELWSQTIVGRVPTTRHESRSGSPAFTEMFANGRSRRGGSSICYKERLPLLADVLNTRIRLSIKG